MYIFIVDYHEQIHMQELIGNNFFIFRRIETYFILVKKLSL